MLRILYGEVWDKARVALNSFFPSPPIPFAWTTGESTGSWVSTHLREEVSQGLCGLWGQCTNLKNHSQGWGRKPPTPIQTTPLTQDCAPPVTPLSSPVDLQKDPLGSPDHSRHFPVPAALSVRSNAEKKWVHGKALRQRAELIDAMDKKGERMGSGMGR